MKSRGQAHTGRPYYRGARANRIDVEEEESDEGGVELWNAEWAMRGRIKTKS